MTDDIEARARDLRLKMLTAFLNEESSERALQDILAFSRAEYNLGFVDGIEAAAKIAEKYMREECVPGFGDGIAVAIRQAKDAKP